MSPVSRAAFQGEFGAFSEEAVCRFFGESGEEVDPVPCREFVDVGRAVMEGEAEYGVLPIENTLAGSVIPTYNVLASHDLAVIGEVVIPIHHCVLGIPGARVEELARVLSHPVALAQCTRFLRGLAGAEAVAVYDTAGAAKEVADRGSRALGAIAGRQAAERYGLEVLVPDVEDRSDNQTRFLVVTRADAAHPPLPAVGGGVMRTLLLVQTGNIPGALVRVLLPFAGRGINLSKLESRPTGEPWSYHFFMEMDADSDSPAARQALDEVRESASLVRVLGSYPRWSRSE